MEILESPWESLSQLATVSTYVNPTTGALTINGNQWKSLTILETPWINSRLFQSMWTPLQELQNQGRSLEINENQKPPNITENQRNSLKILDSLTRTRDFFNVCETHHRSFKINGNHVGPWKSSKNRTSMNVNKNRAVHGSTQDYLATCSTHVNPTGASTSIERSEFMGTWCNPCPSNLAHTG